MTSPFPGIDPYLEDPAFWSDFHSSFINYWREAIADALPDNYEAGIGKRVYLIEYEPLTGGGLQYSLRSRPVPATHRL